VSAPTADMLAERTLALCRIASPIGQEQALADHVEAWARAHYPPTHVYRLNHTLLLGTLEDPRPTVALVGHLDTVPAHPGDAPPHRDGSRVVGLGSSDMKGGLAVMMALAEALPRETLPVNLLLLLYEREEGPYLESGLTPLFEQRPDLKKVAFAVAMEPTDCEVQVGCVGSLHATLRFHGRSAHSARPWQGENAIHKAGPLLAELLERPRREVVHGGFPFYEVMSVTKASGGRAKNVVPEAFELNLNYRFAPGRTVEQAQEDVQRLVAGRAEVSFTDLAPSGRVCADNPHYRRLLAAGGLTAAAKQAWTDVARFSAFGVDAVNFGPGETAQAHQAHESCGVEPLERAYRALEKFLTSPL
jgi:succinyl-diaminopimelate desuccinylase